MNLEEFREYCLSKPRATEGTPFGPDTLVFKVGGKIFAIASLDEIPPRANLKCNPDLALELRDRYEQVRPGYHMNKKHWNTVDIETGIPETELRRMIDHSYELVAKSLPTTRPRKKGGSSYAPASAARMCPDRNFAAERRPSPKTMLSTAAKPRRK